MTTFLIVRIIESILFFSMAFYGYLILNSNESADLFILLLSTATLTFAFSLASNHRLKFQKNQSYYSFQFYLFLLSSIVMQVIFDYGALLAFIVFIKSTLIIHFRIINKNQFLSLVSCAYPLFGLVYVYLLDRYNWEFDPVYIVLANLIGVLLFLIHSSSFKELKEYTQKHILYLSIKELSPIAKYLPVLGLMFYFTNYDKFFVSSIFDSAAAEVYARIEVLAQIPLMIIMMVIFYFNPRIFSQKKIRKYFLQVKKYDALLIILSIVFAFIYAYVVTLLNGYFDLIEDSDLVFNAVVIASKVFAVYVSIQIIYWQLKHQEISYTFILLSVHLLFFMCAYSYTIFFEMNLQLFLIMNVVVFLVFTWLFSKYSAGRKRVHGNS